MLTLNRLPLGYRFLYTGVLLFMTGGSMVHTLHQQVRGGLSPAALTQWYRGNEDDPAPDVLLFPRSFEEVIGDSWLAVTTYTLAFLIFGSILFRSSTPPLLRAGLPSIYAALGLAAGASPLLIRYAASGWAYLAAAALVALPVLAACMSALALLDMWRKGSPRPRIDRERSA